MLGWLSAAIAWASRSKRSLNWAAETLIATSRPNRGSRARYTSPMPPAPMGARISYGPSLSPAESGMGVAFQVYSTDGWIWIRKAGRQQLRDGRALAAESSCLLEGMRYLEYAEVLL